MRPEHGCWRGVEVGSQWRARAPAPRVSIPRTHYPHVKHRKCNAEVGGWCQWAAKQSKKWLKNGLVIGREQAYNNSQVGSDVVRYLKTILSGVAALFLAEVVPGPWSMFRGMSAEKATGLAAVVGGFVESLFSPLFWVLAILLFLMFFYASRLGNKALRVLLFWTPTLLLSSILILFAAFVVFAFLHIPRQ